MKIFLIKRTDKIDYDEYDSFVVIAKNKKHAIELIKISYFIEENTYCKEIKIGKKGKIILGSYNAG